MLLTACPVSNFYRTFIGYRPFQFREHRLDRSRHHMVYDLNAGQMAAKHLLLLLIRIHF
ncbi:hypothetical protein D3C80_2217650 [compost metagenome]